MDNSSSDNKANNSTGEFSNSELINDNNNNNTGSNVNNLVENTVEELARDQTKNENIYVVKRETENIDGGYNVDELTENNENNLTESNTEKEEPVDITVNVRVGSGSVDKDVSKRIISTELIQVQETAIDVNAETNLSDLTDNTVAEFTENKKQTENENTNNDEREKENISEDSHKVNKLTENDKNNQNQSSIEKEESFDFSVNVQAGSEKNVSASFEENEAMEIKHDSPKDEEKNQATKNIVVTVTKDGVEKELKVEIIDQSPKKPFLGGFRHKLTGAEYLNASCQPYPKLFFSDIEKYNRDTQTVITRNQVQQTFNNTSTQMTKPGCYVSDATDVVRIPGKYVTADEREHMIMEKVIILQCYWRRWLATQYVKKLRNDRDMRIQWEKAQVEQRAAERAQRLQKEFERRMKPKTKADFDLLYAALERWRREETERINEMHSGPERKAALIGLLEQESYLIQSIERHRLNADQENSDKKIRAFLNKAASPKFWRAYDGKMTMMNTPFTLRAQELNDLYSSLQMKYLNHDERLDVLLTLKHTVKEHECKLTQDLMELIDREADLLTRGIKVENLEGLRQRISTLFLQFCKTPLFNPEAARLLKVPQDASSLRKDIYFCPSCNSYLTSAEFPLASNSKIVGRCIKCSRLDNNARLRHDFTKIRCIMQHLRRTEEAYNDHSKFAFIIQDADLRYLIENIWNSQSALSGLDDLYDLIFVRWNKHEHWSPWNCVLLTKEEASAHTKLENVVEAYGRIFIGKVHQRHVLARKYFSKLTNVSDALDKTMVQKSKQHTTLASVS